MEYSRRMHRNNGLQHNVPDEMLAAIGDMTVSFSLVEQMMAHFCDGFVQGPQRTSQMAFTLLSFRNLRTLAGALYREIFEEDDGFKTLKLILTRAARLEETRNRLIHSEWIGQLEASSSALREKSVCRETRGFTKDRESVQASSLRETALEMRLLARELLSFHLEMIDKRAGLDRRWAREHEAALQELRTRKKRSSFKPPAEDSSPIRGQRSGVRPAPR